MNLLEIKYIFYFDFNTFSEKLVQPTNAIIWSYPTNFNGNTSFGLLKVSVYGTNTDPSTFSDATDASNWDIILESIDINTTLTISSIDTAIASITQKSSNKNRLT